MSTPILTNFEFAIALMAMPLLPLAIYALAKGSPAPPGTFLARYFNAEPLLGPIGNLFLIVVCLVQVNKLAAHFVFLDLALYKSLNHWLMGIFGVVLLIDLAIWVRAAIKVRRGVGVHE